MWSYRSHAACPESGQACFGIASAAKAGTTARCLVEVNVGDEATKGGVTVDRLEPLLESCASLASLHVEGLMAIPPPGGNGVLVASRHKFEDGGPVSEAVPEPWRMVRAYLGPVRVYGIYMPNLLKKIPYWQTLIAALNAPRPPVEFVRDPATGRISGARYLHPPLPPPGA